MGKRSAKKREPVVRLFARRLREVRLGRGMTQADLAAAAGVSVTYVSELEGAATTPGIDLVARLARTLGTTAGDLLPGEEPPDSLDALKEHVRGLSEELLAAADREALLTLAPILALVLETARKRH